MYVLIGYSEVRRSGVAVNVQLKFCFSQPIMMFSLIFMRYRLKLKLGVAKMASVIVVKSPDPSCATTISKFDISSPWAVHVIASKILRAIINSFVELVRYGGYSVYGVNIYQRRYGGYSLSIQRSSI
ncbi:hypothetical protein FH972_006337 [Carpinus fangiana]|uniref:Uncharacterized protein n=1 Tax=Carpinus fangiana TaxID=176857 RepID=A0A5N6QVG8_9ROSI|nr:hypothetical protein FH972_006337 [Carpinus fangiana]